MASGETATPSADALEAHVTLVTRELQEKGATAVIIFACYGSEMVLSFQGEGEQLVGMMETGGERMEHMIRSGSSLVKLSNASIRLN